MPFYGCRVICLVGQVRGDYVTWAQSSGAGLSLLTNFMEEALAAAAPRLAAAAEVAWQKVGL